MDNHALSLIEHARQESPIEPDRREEVLVEGALPLLIVEHRKTARRSRRAADDVYNDVHAAEPFENCIGHSLAAFSGRNVRGDEELGVRPFGGSSSGSGKNPHTLLAQPRDHRQPDTLRAARDERPAVLQIQAAHGRISSEEILSPSSPNTN